jgi:membrane protease YdiL (CAAX protease family)
VQKWVRSLSPASEFAVVILGAFGYFIFTSFVAHLQRSSNNLTDARLEYLILHELIVGATLAIFLLTRGWSLKRIGLAPTLKDTGVGLLLVAVYWIAWATIWILVAGFSQSTVQAAKEVTTISAAPGIAFWIVALASLVNGTFEETFVCGYVITALRDRSTPWTAINISVGITLLYHLYQGPIGMMSVVLTSVSFGYWYAQTGRLWPPIVAHAVIDFLALYP